MRSKTLKLRCYFCGGRLRTDNAFLEVYDQELPPFHNLHPRFNEHGGQEFYGALTYPENGQYFVREKKWNGCSRVVLFTHAKCGPDIGYAFSFDDLGRDWDEHLQEKGWWCSAIAEGLEIARTAMGIKTISRY